MIDAAQQVTFLQALVVFLLAILVLAIGLAVICVRWLRRHARIVEACALAFVLAAVASDQALSASAAQSACVHDVSKPIVCSGDPRECTVPCRPALPVPDVQYVIDAGSGCHYLVFHFPSSIAVTPRLDRRGRHVCRGAR